MDMFISKMAEKYGVELMGKGWDKEVALKPLESEYQTDDDEADDALVEPDTPNATNVDLNVPASKDSNSAPSEDHVVIAENQTGVNFDKLFGPYLAGATEITLTDPYLRLFHQIRNLMEFVETVIRSKAPEDNVSLNIITSLDDTRGEQQVQYLEQVKLNAETAGVRVAWEFDGTGTIHARHITTNTGWKILLDRGLDVFQRYEMNDAFSLANRIQEQRACKGFEVTYVRAGPQ